MSESIQEESSVAHFSTVCSKNNSNGCGEENHEISSNQCVVNRFPVNRCAEGNIFKDIWVVEVVKKTELESTM